MIRWVLSFIFIIFSQTALAGAHPSFCDSLLSAPNENRIKALIKEYYALQKNFTDAGAAKLQNELIAYYDQVHIFIKNFNPEEFMHERLTDIPGMEKLSEEQTEGLKQILAPYFKTHQLPGHVEFRNDFKDSLHTLPMNQIYLALKKAFEAWETKIIFDEHGTAMINRLTKNLVEKRGLAEVSENVAEMAKNEFLAFFESEQGPGQFNPSFEAILRNHFGATEVHESTHMVVQTLASQGRLSPFHIHITLDKKYLKNGAVGSIQKHDLARAIHMGQESDFYRTEFYLDEIIAHRNENSVANDEISKALYHALNAYLDANVDEVLKSEVFELYADYILSHGQVLHRDRYSKAAHDLFNTFLQFEPSDLGHSGVTVPMTKLLNNDDSIHTLTNQALAELKAAEVIVDQMSAHPEKIHVKKDVFLGQSGYLVPIRIPVDVYTGSSWKQEIGMSVQFRFTNQGAYSPNLDTEKLGQLKKQLSWAIQYVQDTDAGLVYTIPFIRVKESHEYTVENILHIQEEQTRLRVQDREMVRLIRAAK